MNRNILLTSTFFVTFLVYLFAILSWVSIQSFTNLIQRWSRNSEMTVYLRFDVKQSEIETLIHEFQQFSDQITAQFQSSDDIRNNLKKLMPKSDYDFTGSDDLVAAIPPHFILKSRSNLIGESLFELFRSMSDQIRKNPAVASSSFGKSWTDKYTTLLKSFHGANWAFLGGLSLALILIFGNTIRSHIHNQKETIEILELVGATPAMIRQPFLIEGTILSTGSMIVALSTTALLIHFLKATTGDLVVALDVKNALWELTPLEWMSSLFMAALLGFLGSYLCLSEINTGWAASKGTSRHV